MGIAALASALALVAAGPTGTAVGDETGKDKNADSKAAAAAEAPAPLHADQPHVVQQSADRLPAPSEKLIDELNRTIDGTAGGATIRIATYLFDMRPAPPTS